VLTQFYVQSMCVPTRAALLTRRYPMRYGLQRMNCGLSLAERTLAGACATSLSDGPVGKWDLGFDSPEQRPRARGFDHQYGPYHASIDSFQHTHRGGLDWHRDDLPLREAGYATTLLGAEAARLIDGHDPDQPLSCCWLNAPHAPLAAQNVRQRSRR
jgi:arylsulfatase A-like enzyme